MQKPWIPLFSGSFPWVIALFIYILFFLFCLIAFFHVIVQENVIVDNKAQSFLSLMDEVATALILLNFVHGRCDA